MNITAQIREFVLQNPGKYRSPVATEAQIREAEETLRREIPGILKESYLTIGNGGFGPGYGVIGLVNGHRSDFGNLIETYTQLKNDQEKMGREWDDDVIPFCFWGCNIFSCVKCGDESKHKERIYTFENLSLWPQRYNLTEFFELWMRGVDILEYDSEYEESTSRIINPFTKQVDTVRQRKRIK